MKPNSRLVDTDEAHRVAAAVLAHAEEMEDDRTEQTVLLGMMMAHDVKAGELGESTIIAPLKREAVEEYDEP